MSTMPDDFAEAEESVEERTKDEPGDFGAPIDDAIVARGRELLDQILNHCGIETTVEARNDVDHLTLELHGDTSGILIGRKGQMLDALEYIVGRILAKEFTRTVHVTVDSQGYRGRRQESLEDLARRMAEEARRKRRPIELADLSPRERRIVHMTLRDEHGVLTKSSGEGHLRTLVISPISNRGPREE